MSDRPKNSEQPAHQALQRVLGGAAVLACSWFLMMVIHEAGHIVAAVGTGGIVQNIQLQPLAISRTDVDPNPNRLLVVWAGPIVGALLPVVAIAIAIAGITNAAVVRYCMFFRGFCLIANGAYIAVGSFEQVGDCKIMLQEGSPHWALLLFGGATVPLGLWQWHQMGSFWTFLSFADFDFVHAGWSIAALLILVAIQLAAWVG